MAAGKRKRVSTLGRRSDLVCLTYLSEWLQKPSEGQRFVVPRICIQGLVIYYRINHLPRLLFPNIRTRTPRVVDKVLRAQTQVARCVFYLVMVELATTAHVPLGATSGQFISSLSREGLSNGTRYFPLIYIVTLTVDQHQQGSGDATLSFRFPAWFFLYSPKCTRWDTLIQVTYNACRYYSESRMCGYRPRCSLTLCPLVDLGMYEF